MVYDADCGSTAVHFGHRASLIEIDVVRTSVGFYVRVAKSWLPTIFPLPDVMVSRHRPGNSLLSP